MNFNIKTFNIDQLHKEHEYILNTYFSSLKDYGSEVSEAGDFNYKKVYFNGLPYLMYYTNKNDFDVLLIPKDKYILDNEFEDIIMYRGNKDGLNFSIIGKYNGIVEVKSYDFTTDELGYSVGDYLHETFEDTDNKLHLSTMKPTIAKYLKNLNVRKLVDNCLTFNRIKRNSSETKLNKIQGTSLLEAYESFDKNLEIIEDNESPILKLLEELNKKKVR